MTCFYANTSKKLINKVIEKNNRYIIFDLDRAFKLLRSYAVLLNEHS